MTIPNTVIVQTGTANNASMITAIGRLGSECRLSTDASTIRHAERLVLPGVGTFGATWRELARRDLIAPIRERIESGRPTLAVCVGLQLLGNGSEESTDCRGFGIINDYATRFSNAIRVPQLGWNRVDPEADCTFCRPGFAYYANSYRLTRVPLGWRTAFSEHGGPFLAAIERNGVLACQFHPELSGSWGLDLMRRWLAQC